MGWIFLYSGRADVTNFDLPASQRSVRLRLRLRACRSPAVVRGEPALQSRHVQEDGRDEPRLVQKPGPVLKLANG